jgi:UDP-glucose 4-epimerase
MLVKHPRQTALGWFVRLALDDEEIEIWGDGRQLRDYTYVDDVVRAFLLAGATDSTNGHVLNLGGLRPISHLDLVQTLIGAAGSGSYRLVDFPAKRKRIDIGDAYSSYERATQLLGWQPTVDLADGLKMTVEYYRTRREEYW